MYSGLFRCQLTRILRVFNVRGLDRHYILGMALLISMTLPIQAVFAQGYSDSANQEIWRLRLDAQKFASSESKKECSWSPDSPNTFSDQLILDEKISNKGLLIKIMSALRLDQNARAVSSAFLDHLSNAKVGEVDASNLPILKKIISTHGFPTVNEIGERGVNAMLLLLAHADQDLAFQRSAASIMKDEVAEGKLPGIYLLVLKSIRPNIFQSATIPDGELSEKNPANGNPPSGKSKRECYNHAYQGFMDAYIRKNLVR